MTENQIPRKQLNQSSERAEGHEKTKRLIRFLFTNKATRIGAALLLALIMRDEGVIHNVIENSGQNFEGQNEASADLLTSRNLTIKFYNSEHAIKQAAQRDNLLRCTITLIDKNGVASELNVVLPCFITEDDRFLTMGFASQDDNKGAGDISLVDPAGKFARYHVEQQTGKLYTGLQNGSEEISSMFAVSTDQGTLIFHPEEPVIQYELPEQQA